MRNPKFERLTPGHPIKSWEDAKFKRAAEEGLRPVAGEGIQGRQSTVGNEYSAYDSEPSLWIRILSGGGGIYSWEEVGAVSSGSAYPTAPLWEAPYNGFLGGGSGYLTTMPAYETNLHQAVPAGCVSRAWLATTNDRIFFTYAKNPASGSQGGTIFEPLELQVSGNVPALTIYQDSTTNIAYQWNAYGVTSGKEVNTLSSGLLTKEVYSPTGHLVYDLEYGVVNTYIRAYSPENSGANLKTLNTDKTEDLFYNPHGDNNLTFLAGLNQTLIDNRYPSSFTSGQNLFNFTANAYGFSGGMVGPVSGQSGAGFYWNLQSGLNLTQRTYLPSGQTSNSLEVWRGGVLGFALGPEGRVGSGMIGSGSFASGFLPSSPTGQLRLYYQSGSTALGSGVNIFTISGAQGLQGSFSIRLRNNPSPATMNILLRTVNAWGNSGSLSASTGNSGSQLPANFNHLGADISATPGTKPPYTSLLAEVFSNTSGTTVEYDAYFSILGGSG